MIALFRSELLRLTSRRLLRWLGLLLMVGIVVVGILNFVTSNRDQAEALRLAEEDVARCEAERAEYIERFGEQEVEGWECGRPEDFLLSYDRGFRYVGEVNATTRGVSIVLLVLAVIVGASFGGAESSSGSMATLLTWEPRRFRVLAARLVVCGLVVAVVAFVALALLAVVHLPAGYLRGYTEGLGTSFWRYLSAIWARSGVLAGMFAMAGTAIAVAVRNTAGAVGIAAIYGSVVDPLLTIWRQGALREWLLAYNVTRFQGFPVRVERPVRPGEVVNFFGERQTLITELQVLPVWRSALLLSVYVLAVLAIAYLVFERRDVT